MRPEQMGSLENKLWIVNSNPKRGDSMGPMSSSVGKQFCSIMVGCGRNISEVRFDYMVAKVPPPGKMKKPIEHFQDIGIFDAELDMLKARIREFKPNIVLGLGAEVQRHLLGVTNLNKWRGHAIWSDELQCKIMITYDPYHANNQRRVPKEQKPGQYMTLMKADIAKAVRESETPYMMHDDPDLIFAPSYEQTVQELTRMIDEAKIVSYDIEVFEPYEGRLIDCIGFCDNTERAICVPFYMQDPDNKVVRYFSDERQHFHVWQLVKELMESQIPKVAQNSSFDTTMLMKYYGVNVQNLVWDTMVIQHCLYCDLPKDLGTLISLYTNLPYHKYMIHEAGNVARWKYNAADAVANLHVMQGQIREIFEIEGVVPPALPRNGAIPQALFDIPFMQHYYKVCNPAIASCVYMHIAGVKVDSSLRESVIEMESGYIDQLDEALNMAIPIPLHKNKKNPQNFNPKSPQQKGTLFYDILGCKHQRNKGKITTDKNALKAFLSDDREYVSVLAKACIEAKAADARLLKFKVEPDDGYIRTQYDVTGTDTGRLASKESDVMRAGTNLQNVAKGPQRQMLIPEDGEEFALVDLYAAEAYLNALDAGEMEMLKMISGPEEDNVVHRWGMRIMNAKVAEKYKIHNWMQRTTFENWPDECEDANYTYKDAKQSIHGLNYAVEPPMMSRESGLPISVTSWQYAMYHTKFPGIKGRMTRINTDIKRTKSLTSALGRRRFFMMDVCQDLFKVAYAWPSQSTIGEITICAQNYLHMISDMHEAGYGGVPFMRPVLNTHDGLAIRIKQGTREDVIPWICNAFNIPLVLNDLEIRIPVSIGFAPNFNDMEDEDVYFYPNKWLDKSTIPNGDML